MNKIGIFGGAFNPIHNGHINIAKQAFEELKLNKMLIIPTAEPPHKDRANVKFADRAEMCRLAFENEKNFEISEIEKQLGGKSYSINTLRALKEIYPKNTMFYLIIGGDMLFYFRKWYRYESVLNECKVVAAAREDNEYIDLLEFANELGKVKVLNLEVVPASSTQIREELSATGFSDKIPPSVMEYIKEKKIYTE